MSTTNSPTLFDELGGEPRLRAIIDEFIDRVFADTMIGFFFAQKDRQRIKEKEFELAARHLGADIPYTGRGLPEAHRAHPIMGGHFMRRLRILRDVLERQQVPAHIIEHWLEHNERMRGAITRHQGSDCQDAEGSSSGAESEPPKAPRRLPLAFANPSPSSAKESASARIRSDGRRELPLIGERAKKDEGT